MKRWWFERSRVTGVSRAFELALIVVAWTLAAFVTGAMFFAAGYGMAAGG